MYSLCLVLKLDWSICSLVEECRKSPLVIDALMLVAAGHIRPQAAQLMHILICTITRAKKKQRLYGDIEGGKEKTGDHQNLLQK